MTDIVARCYSLPPGAKPWRCLNAAAPWHRHVWCTKRPQVSWKAAAVISGVGGGPFKSVVRSITVPEIPCWGEVIRSFCARSSFGGGEAAGGAAPGGAARYGPAVRPTVRVLRYGDVTASLHPQAATVFGNSVRFPLSKPVHGLF